MTNDMKFVLYYKKLSVPTKMTATVKNNEMKQTYWIDLEHLRDLALLPCDVLEEYSAKFAILGAIDLNHLIATKLNNGNIFVFII